MGDQEGSDTGVARLRRFFDYILATPDQSKVAPPPLELVEWSQDTLLAAVAGILVGGVKQWREERLAGPPQAPADAPTPAHAARAVAEEQTQRLVRTFDSSVRYGFRIGSAAAVYYGVQLLSSIYRAQHDFLNSAYGGLAAGALLGAVGRTPTSSRFRSIVLGASLGGAVGVPAGLLQEKVAELLPPEQRRAQYRQPMVKVTDIIEGRTPEYTPEWQGRHSENATEAIIKQLEESLAGSPTKLKSPDTKPDQDVSSPKSWFGWFSGSSK